MGQCRGACIDIVATMMKADVTSCQTAIVNIIWRGCVHASMPLHRQNRRLVQRRSPATSRPIGQAPRHPCRPRQAQPLVQVLVRRSFPQSLRRCAQHFRPPSIRPTTMDAQFKSLIQRMIYVRNFKYVNHPLRRHPLRGGVIRLDGAYKWVVIAMSAPNPTKTATSIFAAWTNRTNSHARPLPTRQS